MAETTELTIHRLGAQGDGIAETAGGPVYVPLTLAGERVSAVVTGDQGRLVEVLSASPLRVAPPCPHFGQCGGCALQHMERQAYDGWKREQAAIAFRQRGIEAPLRDLLVCTGKRRRAAMSARLAGSDVIIGFHAAGTHDLIAIDTCIVMQPEIVKALPALRVLIAQLVPRRGEMRAVVTWTAAGLDVALEDIAAKLTPDLRAWIARSASAAGFARVSIAGDPVYVGLQPFLKFGKAEVVPPPGAFLQAVADQESAMANLIAAAVGKSKTVADLFCGLGAFTFRLAERAKVFAADSDKQAMAALLAAAKKATGLKPVEARLRDLFREPLSATELNDFEAVVFDPPRAGAEAQAKMIARSKVKTVVAVSCNPATLARDARHLIDGGYNIESVTPVDQFLYSPHIEAVAVFRR